MLDRRSEELLAVDSSLGGSVKRLILLVVLVSFGCAPELGEGDVESAREVVYDQRGLPAFAGQAIMIQSCGAGGHCHSPEIEPSKERV